MFFTSKRLIYVLTGLILASVVLAYFGRPRQPILEMVSPRQELPGYTEHYPGDTRLAERVAKSYGLALVLVQSPYTDKNVIALESVRSWARQQFQRDPDFLHPVSLESPDTRPQTMVGALFYNLFAGTQYFLEEHIGDLVSSRIDQFHDSSAYVSFRNAYFDLFGMDADAAALLARYQTEKAKLAVNVILWALPWVAAFIGGVIWLFSAGAGSRYERLQRILACGWLLVAGAYLVLACMANETSALLSAFVAAAAGLYLRYPLKVARSDSGDLRIRAICLGTHWIALAAWLSFSLLALLVITWIRTGTAANPDPISLILSSLTGNFLHDPADGKRFILKAMAGAWVVIGLWVAGQLKGDARLARQTERELACLGEDRARQTVRLR